MSLKGPINYFFISIVIMSILVDISTTFQGLSGDVNNVVQTELKVTL